MINVAFVPNVSSKWMGGVNYFKNLFYALSKLEGTPLNIIVFVGYTADPKIVYLFGDNVQIVRSKAFDRYSFLWFINKLCKKVFGIDVVVQFLFRRYRVQVLSHSPLFHVRGIKILSWIPDFQHKHLPDMFSVDEKNHRDKAYSEIAVKSDRVLLSSLDAYQDFNKFFPGYNEKSEILNFVSQLPFEFEGFDQAYLNSVKEKYALSDNFFFVPNQFWKHKNHSLLFEAINIINKKGVAVQVVCCGLMEDYRHEGYINELTDYLKRNDLSNCVRCLGVIDYSEVFALMAMSEAVINPSLFEGWSSTVEECKTLNKKMILSDINVHIEQYPQAYFFKRDSVEDLSEKLLSVLSGNCCSGELVKDVRLRTKDYAKRYCDIVSSLF